MNDVQKLVWNTNVIALRYPVVVVNRMINYFTALVAAWLYRDIIMSLGVIDASRDSLEYTLTQQGAGHSVVLIVGGAAEITDTRHDSYVLTLKRRKGFIKLALETGFVLCVCLGAFWMDIFVC